MALLLHPILPSVIDKVFQSISFKKLSLKPTLRVTGGLQKLSHATTSFLLRIRIAIIIAMLLLRD